MTRWVAFSPPRVWLEIAAVSGLLLIAVNAGGEQAIFRTGTELSETLTRRVGFEISGDPRRDALQMIAGQFRIALFLDRRIDPEVPLTYRTQNTPLGIALEEMASQFNAAVTWIGPLGYIGPAGDVKQLQTVRALVHQQVARFPKPVRQRLMEPQSLRWNRLTTPAEIVQRIADNYQLQWKHPERLPHDLWASGRLPATDCASQLIVILAGFDAMPRFDKVGRSFVLVPTGAAVAISQSYTLPPESQDQTIRQWRQKFPHAKVRREGNQLILTARAEDHWQVDPATKPADMPDQKAAAIGSEGRQVYTLRVEAPMDSILTALARQTGLTLVWQQREIEAVGIDVQQVVKIDVREAALEDLIDQLLKPTGLSFVRDGQRVTVAPEEK
ncbi:MAG: STN domain-containing protein [Pirellulales bacterium]|nr:STN domain-containing protein [Pirellulales bacterium]